MAKAANLGVVKMAFLSAQLMFAGLPFLIPLPGGDDSGVIAVALSAMAVINAGLSAFGWRFVPATTPPQTVFFVRLALAESVSLFGLVAAFMVGRPTVVLPFALAGLVLVAMVGVPEGEGQRG
jgi:hypothetical protein